MFHSTTRNLLYVVGVFTLAILACDALCISTSASGAPLTGTGNNLPIPSPNPGMPVFCPPTLTTIPLPLGLSAFTGTWTPPAQDPWTGQFVATGPIPSSPNSGDTEYDFSGLKNGVLPAGTFFIFGDVDGGSGAGESFTLEARNALNQKITGAWLDDPIAVWGSGTGVAGAILPSDMPGWDLVSIGGTGTLSVHAYVIDGSTQGPGNPSIAFALRSNVPIAKLSLSKATTNYGFALAAPCVPEPSSLCLAAIASLTPTFLRRAARRAACRNGA